MRLRVFATFAACGSLILLAAGCGGSDKPKNKLPALGTTSLAATEDTVLNAQLSASDPDNDPVTFSLATGVSHGQVTVSSSGAVVYTPAANYFGADSFSVRVNDDAGGESTGTVAINVANVNDAPVITTTALNAVEDVRLDAQVAATDIDGNTVTFTLVTDATHGHVAVAANGTLTYTSTQTNYFGADSFAVKVADGAGGEATGTVNVAVAAVDDPPVLTFMQIGVVEDANVSAQLTATDVENDAFNFALATGPRHGQATVAANGQLVYTPSPDFFGADQVEVTVADAGASATSTIAFTVAPVNDPPVATDDDLHLPASASVNIPLLTNDRDVDGDTLQVTLLSQPSGGTLSVTGANTVTFVPDNAYNGPISFNYRVTDAAGVTDDATVHAIVGDYAGIFFLSDETTVGKAELHYFDGFQTRRISGDLEPNWSILSFAQSDDGSKLAYVAQNDSTTRVYIVGGDGTGQKLIYTNSRDPMSGNYAQVKLNRDGGYAAIADPFAAGPRRMFIVRVSDLATTGVGIDDLGIVTIAFFPIFNPVDKSFYVQGQVGGSPTISGTGYVTLFRGNVDSPGAITRVSGTYNPNAGGEGSGWEPAISSDGRYVVHHEYVYSPSAGTKSSILVYDSVANAEAPLYRRPVGSEIGSWNAFDISNDGTRACMKFLEPGSGGSAGPARVYVMNLGTPNTPLYTSPVHPYVGDCSMAVDNATAIYQANNTPTEILRASQASPVPQRVNPELTGIQEAREYFASGSGERFAFGVADPTSNVSSLTSTSFAAPGVHLALSADFRDDRSMPGSLDHDGMWLAYAKRPAPLTGLRRLTLISTQSAGLVVPLTRADSTTGVVQFAWAP